MFSSRSKLCFLLALCVAVMAVSLVLVSVASASFEEVGRFAVEGSGEAELDGSGVAVDDVTSELYVADGLKHRVTRFTGEGGFLGAWGWNVTATGPDKAGIDKVEKITVRGTAGKLAFAYPGNKIGVGLNRTKELEFKGGVGPSAGLVEEEINKLSDIIEEGEGGRVKVEGGPADATGSKPYIVTFEGGTGDVGYPRVIAEGVGLTGGLPSSSAEKEVVTNGASAFEDCVRANGDICRRKLSGESEGEGAGEFLDPEHLAVDQATGDVYVLDDRRSGVVQVFSGDGRELVASFGERTKPGGEPVSASPEEIEAPEDIAVDSSGNVYVVDGRLGERRVMVFDPVPGSEYKKYVYAGVAHDIATGHNPYFVAADPAGDAVYVTDGHRIDRFSPVSPLVPVCVSREFSELIGGLAVDPGSGNVFVNGGLHPSPAFYELNGSCEQVGEFPNPGVYGNGNGGLAFDPSLRFGGVAAGGVRPSGVLYVISQSAGYGSVHAGLIFARPVELLPRVDSEFAGMVGSSSATLQARVDPRGYETSYRFQYGTGDCSLGGCSETPLGGGVLGTGQSDLAAAATVSGLSPDTTYHFRVLVTSQVGTVEGADGTFTTFPVTGTGLPDGRVYELVSPVATDGGEVFPPTPGYNSSCFQCRPGGENNVMPMQSAPDGGSVVYEGQAFTASGGAANENEYLSVRTGTGWQTRDLSPELEQRNGKLDGFKAFSADLSRGVLAQTGPALASGGLTGFGNLYRLDTGLAGEGGLSPLLSVDPPDRSSQGSNEFRVRYAGGSTDLSSIVFEANDALTGPAAPYAPAAVDGNNLYDMVDGVLHLVNVLPGNTTTVPGAVFGDGGPNYDHVVSGDGSRVYWSYGGHVYVRINNESTIMVPDSSGFVTASNDGSRVLLDDGYIYELNEAEGVFEAVTSLSEGHGGFFGILGSSEDLSHVYFVDSSVLATNENENKEVAGGGLNLYSWSNGSSVFVGILNAEDSFNTFGIPGGKVGDWMRSSALRSAQVTPDGRYLTFMSLSQLTGYDNNVESGECVQKRGTACFEVFEYDSVSGRLVCVSCNRTGVRPLGDSYLSLIKPQYEEFFPQPRNLSDDGRVFFDSLDSLSPYDTNGGVEDVYEYEPEGVGSCTSTDGCVSLISSGHDTSDSNFVAADPSGSNVFFMTRSNLTGDAPGDLYRLFDARVNGGFPEVTPVACTGTGCQGTPGAPPVFATPSSVTFNGVGNYTNTPPAAPQAKPKAKKIKCAKGRALAHGKCVNQKAKARHARARKGSVKRQGRGS